MTSVSFEDKCKYIVKFQQKLPAEQLPIKTAWAHVSTLYQRLPLSKPRVYKIGILELFPQQKFLV